MKKFAIKSIAIAASAVCAGAAFASVNLDTGVTSASLANELNYSSAGGTAVTGQNVVTTKLGFGVSATQDRYIRVDLVGAKLAAASLIGNVPAATPAFVNSILVSGGALGDTYAIYQITSGAAGNAATDPVTFTLPDLHVTNANAAPVTVTYTLFETATAAVANLPGTNLYSASGSLLKFKTGLVWTLTPGTNTAAVSTLYKKFNPAAPTLGPVAIGSLNYGVDAAVVNATAGAVALTDLVTTATATFTSTVGSFLPSSALFLDANDACATVGTPAVTLVTPVTKVSATAPLNTTPKLGNLCYTAGGTLALDVQTINAALAVVPPATASTASVAAASIGLINHDGTELQAPLVQQPGGWLPRVVLTNTGATDAPYTGVFTAAPGSTITANASVSGTIPAGGQVIIEGAAMPQFAGGAGRAFSVFTIAGPNGTIQGVFSLANPVTGGVTNYVMVRPGTN